MLKLFFPRLFGKKPKPPKLHRGTAKFNARYPMYEIGTGTYGMPIIHDWSEGSTLKIGAYCSIAQDVNILLGGGHRTDWITTFPFPAFIEEGHEIQGYAFSKGDVIIGNDVWLGTNCMILSGVTIQTGAVVAACSVVTRDVPAYAVVAGNPARIIRWRFDPTTREKLLETQWWKWPEVEIRANAQLLCSDRISDFLEYAEKRNRNL